MGIEAYSNHLYKKVEIMPQESHIRSLPQRDCRTSAT